MRGFSLLSGGSAVIQVVSLLLAPILTRLYSPAEYGVNAVFISLLTICGVVATLRLQVPVAMSHDPRERLALSRLCLYAAMIVSVLIAVVVLTCGQTIGSVIGVESVDFLWVLPVSTLVIAMHEVSYQNLLSLKRYQEAARVGIISVASQGLFQIGLSFAHMGYMGLILGNLLSYFVTCSYMALALEARHSVKERIPAHYYRELLRKHADFPRYAFPAELASMGSYQVIPIILTGLFGASAAGYYALANRLIGVPIQLFGNSLRQVFIREASLELRERGTIAHSFARTSRILSTMAVPVALTLFVAAPALFGAVFGEEWVQSGVFVRAMTLMFLARFIVGPLMSTPNVLGRQRSGLVVQTLVLLSVLLVSGAAYAIGIQEAWQFLVGLSAAYAGVQFLFYFVMSAWIRGLGGVTEST